MMAVLFILAGYAILPILVVVLKSPAATSKGHRDMFPAVEIS